MLTGIIVLIIGVSTSFPTNGQRNYRIVVRDSSTALLLTKPDTFTTFNILPILPDSMSYDEFKYLQLRLTNEDRMWSLLLPGYTHFVTYDSRSGLGIMALRMFGYWLIGYSICSGIPESVEDINIEKIKVNLMIFGAGVGLNFAGWLYDIVHGEYRLREKQLSILYRYRRVYPLKLEGE